MGTRVLLPRNNRIADLEFSDISGGNNSSAYCSGDELSSLSGYESIEGNIDNIYPPNTGPGNKKKTDLNMTSFSNPNYLCPDAKTILERKQQKNKFDETILPPTTTTVAQLTRDESHQNFAAALNSPAESLISDYQVSVYLFSNSNLCLVQTLTVSTSTNSTRMIFSAIGIKLVLVEFLELPM